MLLIVIKIVFLNKHVILLIWQPHIFIVELIKIVVFLRYYRFDNIPVDTETFKEQNASNIAQR